MPSSIAADNDLPVRMFGDCTYEEIEDAYQTSVREVARRAPDFRQHEAMDASHDAALAWLVMVRDGKYDRTRAKLSTLACRIALRKLWRRLAKIAAEGKRQVSISGDREPPQPTQLVARWSDEAWRKEVLDALDASLECLTDLQRTVIIRRYCYGCTYLDIGFQLSMAEGAVRAHAFRARVKMAESPRVRAVLAG